MECRACGAALERVFVDLRSSPLANSYLQPEALDGPETFYPLRVMFCERCLLVQLPAVVAPEAIFEEYAYFSSYSDSWLAHARRFAEGAIERFELGAASRVVEVASNDGYLLQYFRQRQVPVLGVEPARNVARVAEEAGIPTRVAFFSAATARQLVDEGLRADLLIGNNVLSQIPELRDFVEGLAIALQPGGVVSLEFHHLLHLIADGQFDTIYHEHFSYFSFLTVQRVLEAAGLTVFDVEELPTHGGSLRVMARHAENDALPVGERVGALLDKERGAGLGDPATYLGYEERVREVKRGLLEFLIGARRAGKSVVGYGAAAKGNTLLNYCGIGPDMIDYVVDRSPHKQGCFLPGSRIPILGPEQVAETRPDYLLILPWNLRQEITEQMAAIREWGGAFCVAVPRLEVFD